MIGAHHEFVVLGCRITRHVVASVIIKMHALQICYVAIAVRQEHVKSSVVHDEAIEIHRREGKHGLDAVGRACRIVQNMVTHHAFTAA